MKVKGIQFIYLIASCLIFLSIPSSLASQPILQPQCLEPVGIRPLVDRHPQLTGETVRLGIVELAQPDPNPDPGNQTDYVFLPNFDHQAFTQTDIRSIRSYENYPDNPRYSPHATMLAGILLGFDENAYYPGMDDFIYLGIVPDAVLDIYEAKWFICKALLAFPDAAFDNDILSISWGTDANDDLTLWWQRGIDALAEHQNCLVIAGCGNGVQQFQSITKPSWGFNVISVGTARSLGGFPDCLQYLGPPVSRYSTTGPTEDSRAKPDVIAPGLALGPAADSNYAYCLDHAEIGTSSFATPQVTGVAALLIDAARQYNLPHADDPRLIKALILNGANKLNGWHKGLCTNADDHTVPLDYQQGAGLVNAFNSCRQLLAGPCSPNQPRAVGWDLHNLPLDPNDPNSQKLYHLPYPLPHPVWLKATLTWFRRYDKNQSFNPLPLTNLMLELWTLDEENQLRDRLDFSASRTDNLQHLYFHCTTPDHLVLRVQPLPCSTPPRPFETYALAWAIETTNWPGDLLLADINSDGIVNVNDMLQWIKTFRQSLLQPTPSRTPLVPTPYRDPADFNGDGYINAGDFDTLARQWLQHSSWHHE